jgi:arylsulfate sulfotransferase
MNDNTLSRCLWTLRHAWSALIACAAAGLVACGEGGNQAAQSVAVRTILTGSEAAVSAAYLGYGQPVVSPFISLVDIQEAGLENLAAVEFTIAPKPGAVSKAVHVLYSIAALTREGHVSRIEDRVTLPVFGLYAGFANQVLVQLDFLDGSTRSAPTVITTPQYSDPNGIYDHPTILKPRATGSALGFDFFVMKSGLGSPVIVDTDGEVRWLSTGVDSSISSAAVNEGFVIGSQSSPTLYRLGLDGSLNQTVLPQPPYVDFHHNIDYGKEELFAEVNDNDNGVNNIESTLVEMDPDGTIDKNWELGDILNVYMRSQGDDPSTFVRPGVDWFHMNSAIYDPSDDSVIVSSRENFLIKLDYVTGTIIWILGDPTKYWYNFPSLRAKALTLQPGGLYPIGQHAVSKTSDGLVMVFNDGTASFNQPPGASAGESRGYSAVSAYSIDAGSGTAREVWRFDYGQSIYSSICSSAYEASKGSVLVDYAVADSGTEARLVGLDAAHNVVFDFEYPTQPCNTSWNATPIALDNFSIM